MNPGHRLWAQPGSARGCPVVPGGRALTPLLSFLLPQLQDPHHCQLGGLLAIRYSNLVLPRGVRVAAGAPKWLQSVVWCCRRRREQMPDKGPGTKARLPRAPGKGRRRVQGTGAVPSRGCCCPDPLCLPCPSVHLAPALAGVAGAQLGTRWANPGTGAVPSLPWALCPHCSGAKLCCGPSPALPISGCSGAEMGCRGAQSYGEGAERRDGTTAEGGKYHVWLQSHCASVSPAAIGGPCECFVFPHHPPPRGRLCPHSPQLATNPLSGGSCHSTGLGTPVLPGAAGAVPTHRFQGGFRARCQTVPDPPREGTGHGPN